MQAYIDLLVAQLHTTQTRCTSDIVQLRRDDGQYLIGLGDGSEATFDHLIVATNAEQARDLVRDLPDTGAVRDALGRVAYFDTTIAIHGDASLLPAKRAHGSVVNGGFDGTHCAITDRAYANRDAPLFRSWITHSATKPKPCYAEIAFRHPHPNPDYFRAQQELAPLQGRDKLWFAGMYVTYFDNHEGALLSAMGIAECLAPGTARLKSLR